MVSPFVLVLWYFIFIETCLVQLLKLHFAFLCWLKLYTKFVTRLFDTVLRC